MKKRHLLLLLAILTTPIFCFAQDAEIKVSAIQIGIAILPAVFLFFILLITTRQLRNSKIKLCDFLVEKDTRIIGSAVRATQVSTQSVSRLIAFLTGLVGLVIAICLTVFFIYCYFNDTKPVDLSNFSYIIWGLGIGVIPYGFNKTSAALRQAS